MADRRRTLVLVALLLAAVLAPLAPAVARPERPMPVGSDPFQPGATYRGDFPDPTVWRVGGRFYAASTTIAALNLPLLTSTDLHTWTARPSTDPTKPGLSDAMPAPASWAEQNVTTTGRAWAVTWAPSIARIVSPSGVTTFVAAYSVPRASDGRRCISLARSASAAGPYVDTTTGPLACGTAGVIDPQLYVEGRNVYLMMKVEGAPDRLLSRRMNYAATMFLPGARAYLLATPRYTWEGSVVENPAMIRYRGRLYLFYSGNGYGSSRYATGYAICRTVNGPCTRKGRILYSGAYLSGPGGATPFVDTAGRLRLAYHAWRTGNTGYPSSDACLQSTAGCAQRRMYIATLAAARDGHLVRVRWF